MACAEKSSNRADIARKRVTPVLNSFLEPCGARVGSPVFLRAVKEDSVLELWVKPDKSECYMLAKRYPIAAWSGKLGPKEKEGDRQTPEGFYEVEPSGLNPRSNYHLSFNIGYPNAYDRSLNRTGSFIMVHGRDVSIGCLAMTDSGIEEIYTMVEQALVHGQKNYPFVPTPARLSEEKDSPHAAFWADMARAWDWTERTRTPARVKAVHGRLVVVEQ
ncbi:2-dehydro-3-deoxyphosphooctonate aldolase [Akkermansia muciniphila]|nr:2-dehydro-3-deoxyphosphooctonate aldolase [Akkermansia muciniphila]QHV17646.1 2-dehydro-3-deoxyphosphooctonate aldolase [Akkermansia muciniphila]